NLQLQQGLAQLQAQLQQLQEQLEQKEALLARLSALTPAEAVTTPAATAPTSAENSAVAERGRWTMLFAGGVGLLAMLGALFWAVRRGGGKDKAVVQVRPEVEVPRHPVVAHGAAAVTPPAPALVGRVVPAALPLR